MISIRLLGAVQITRDDAVLRFESRKAVALLCYLAARVQPIPRAQLAELFWPAKDEREGKKALSRLVYHLNAVAPGVVSVDFHRLQLARSQDVWVDAVAFDALVARHTPQALAEAATLYREDFLADLMLDGCPDWEQWQVREREGWRLRATEVYERLVAHYVTVGELAAGIEAARRWLGLEAWQETAHRALMRLLALSGQHRAALAQYEICRRVLLEELDAEPDDETVALYEQIRSGELAALAAPARRPGNLPVQRLTLFGRAGDLQATTAALNRPDVGLLTITGPAGVGKTRLALAAAAQLAGDYAHGAWLVDLAPIADAELVLPAIAHTLGIRPSGAVPLRDDLIRVLRAQTLLLLLDNFEQVLPAAGVLGELLDACYGVKVLVTSRVTLPLYAGVEHALLPLPVPEVSAGSAPPSPHEVAALAEVPSIALFVQRAQAVQRQFTLSTANALAVAQICHRLDGLPLAIELAAGRSRVFSPDALLKRLGRRMEVLASVDADRPVQHRTLRGAIELSYGLLAPARQALFRRLAVFAGGATIEAVEQVCCDDQSSDTVLAGLTELVDHSLLQVFGLDDEPRFRMLETIREYAHELLLAHGDAGPTLHRHARYFLAMAERADRAFDGPDQQVWLDRLAAEQENVRAVLAWLPDAAEDRRLGLRLATSMMRYWSHRDGYDEGRRWLELQLERNPDALAQERAAALISLGRMLEAGHPPHATSVAMQALNLAPDGSAAHIQALLLLGRSERYTGDYAAASAHVLECLALAQRSNATFFSVMANLSLADIALDTGDTDAARQYSHAALRLAASDRYPIDRVWAMVQLGRAAALDGDLDAGRRCFEACVEQFRRVKLGWGVAEVLCDVGQAAYDQGDSIAAATCYSESLPMLLDMYAWRLVPQCLIGTAAVLESVDAARAALELLGTAEALNGRIGSSLSPFQHARYTALRTRLYARFDVETAEQLVVAGRGQTITQATESALAALQTMGRSKTRV